MAPDGLYAFFADRAEGDLLPWVAQREAAERFGLGLAEVEQHALEAALLPGRYRRNRETVSSADQLTLFRSRVAVVGCGGLGGYLVEQLARLGVGTLVLLDPDVFEEHNLNRQLLSSPEHLGRAKVDVAAERVAAIKARTGKAVMKVIKVGEASDIERGIRSPVLAPVLAPGLDVPGTRERSARAQGDIESRADIDGLACEVAVAFVTYDARYEQSLSMIASAVVGANLTTFISAERLTVPGTTVPPAFRR